MARLVFLLEEESMERFLRSLLPRLLPGVVEKQDFLLIPHEGKQDLEKSIPRKLRGWTYPDDHFIVIRDQDSGDCLEVKRHLRTLCERTGKPAGLIRIACRELESWYLGDLETVGRVFAKPKLGRRQGSRLYRTPDNLGSPSKEMKKLIPEFSKLRGASLLGSEMLIEGNVSHSFNATVTGIRQLAEKVL